MKKLLFLLVGLVAMLGVGACAGTAGATSQLRGNSPSNPPLSGDPARDVPPTRQYQWVGTVVESNLEGRHLELDRECDSWVLLPQSREVSRTLEKNIGNKVVVWGAAYDGATIYMRQAISVHAAFGPNDPMPMTLVAIPEYPCPPGPDPRPAPNDPIMLENSDLAVRGTLVWDNGTPYLATPSGKVRVALPRPKLLPGETAAPSADGGAAAMPLSLDVVAAGIWKYEQGALSLAVRTLRPHPVGVMVGKSCEGRTETELLNEGEAAARGTLVRTGGAWYLKTAYGSIMLNERTVMAIPEAADASSAREAVVVGKWSFTSGQLSFNVRRIGLLRYPCPPPPPPPRPFAILAGEIAAVGILVWEGGTPYVQTPSGRIFLDLPTVARTQDIAIPEGAGAPGASPDSAPAAMRTQVIVVGSWSVKSGQLTVAVRWLRPWPLPAPMMGSADAQQGQLMPAAQ